MFMERLALVEKLQGERLTSEAPFYRQLHPYRRAPGWQVRLLSRLGEWMVAKGTALQWRYRHAVCPAKRRASRQMEPTT